MRFVWPTMGPMQSFKMLGCLHTYRRLLVSLVLCVAALLSAAQNTTIVRGVVLDSISNEPLPNVSVMLGETGMGTMTDTNGSFEIKSQSDFSQVTFSTLGYKSQSAKIKSGRNNKLHIALSPMYIPLEEVLVEPSKEKYSKKNTMKNREVENIKTLKQQCNTYCCHKSTPESYPRFLWRDGWE